MNRYVKDFLKGFKYSYPMAVILSTCALSLYFLVLWYRSGAPMQLPIPLGVQTSTGATTFTPTSAIDAFLYISPILGVILGGAVFMFFVVRKNKAKFLKYYAYYAYGSVIAFAIYPAGVNGFLSLFVFVTLPSAAFVINIKYPHHFLFTFSMIFLSAWYGSMLVYMIPFDLAIIMLVIAVGLYDIFAVFVFPLKQIVGQLGKDAQDQKSPIRMMVADLYIAKLGLGDFIFFSVLSAVSFRMIVNNGVYSSFLSAGYVTSVVVLTIVAGMYMTLFLLRYRRPLPALPLSVFPALFVLFLFIK